MNVLRPLEDAGRATARKEHRAALAILHDDANVRVVVFRIEPGQEVPPHRNRSTVLLSVLEGSGEITGAGGPVRVEAGDLITCAPDEMHGMRARDMRFVILAMIAPRPGGG